MNEENNNLPEEAEELEEDYEAEELEEDYEAEESFEEEEEEEISNEEEESEEEQEENSDADDEPEAKQNKTEIDYEAKYKKLVNAGRRMLKTFDIESTDDNVETLIDKLGADNSGRTVEEYGNAAKEEDEFLEYKRNKEQKEQESRNQAYEAQFAAHLAQIQAKFPETGNYKHLKELPHIDRFALLMSTGKITPEEAYRATHPEEIEKYIAGSVRQSSLNDTKAHLKSSAPKKSGEGSSYISKAQMEEYRDMFPELSDSEIINLHKKATK